MAHNERGASRRPAGIITESLEQVQVEHMFLCCTYEKKYEAAALLNALRESAHVDGGQIINLIIRQVETDQGGNQNIHRTSKNPRSPWFVRKSFVMIAF